MFYKRLKEQAPCTWEKFKQWYSEIFMAGAIFNTHLRIFKKMEYPLQQGVFEAFLRFCNLPTISGIVPGPKFIETHQQFVESAFIILEGIDYGKE